MFWKKCNTSPSSIMNSIRIFAVIIILVIFAEKSGGLSRETGDLLVLLMSLYILSWSYREYLIKNPKVRLWIMVVMAVFVFLGVAVMIVRP